MAAAEKGLEVPVPWAAWREAELETLRAKLNKQCCSRPRPAQLSTVLRAAGPGHVDPFSCAAQQEKPVVVRTAQETWEGKVKPFLEVPFLPSPALPAPSTRGTRPSLDRS